jgi:hypothetical protein
MNAGGEWDGEHRIGALVTVSRVKRDYDDRLSSLLGRIGVKLHKPDLAAERDLGV